MRQRGSHKQFRHRDGRATTVTMHRGLDISPIQWRNPGVDLDEVLAEPSVPPKQCSQPDPPRRLTARYRQEDEFSPFG